MSAGRKAFSLARLFATRAHAHPSFGPILPVGCIEICDSGGSFELMLRDESGQDVNEAVVHVTDDSIVGALLFVQGMPRGCGLTVAPERPAGGVALYQGNSVLVLQPPPIGDTDTWVLQLHTPTVRASVTAIVASLIVEVDHCKADGAWAAGCDPDQNVDKSSFAPSLIVVRARPVTVLHSIEDWQY